MITSKREEQQIFSKENYRKSYDNFSYDTAEALYSTYDQTVLHNPVTALWRIAKNKFLDDDGPKLKPEEATQKYGLDTGLIFNEPITDVRARGIYGRKVREIRNKEVLEKSQGGIVAGTAKFTTTLLASSIDPINVATAFIPVARPLKAVGMTRLAAAETAGAVMTRGAIGGAVGAGAIEPIVYYSAQQDQLDYTLNDSLMNIVVGGTLGGAFAGVGHYMHRRRELAKALSDMSGDKLPNIKKEVIGNAKEFYGASHLTDEDFIRAVPEAYAANLSSAENILRTFGLKQQAVKNEKTLIQFIQERGGIFDGSNEVRNLGVKPKERPGLITNKQNKQNLPDMILREAQQAGYFPKSDPNAPEDLSLADLYDAIDKELRGLEKKRLSQVNLAEEDILKRQEELRAQGFDENMSKEEIFDELMRRDMEARPESLEADMDQAYPDRLLDEPPDSAYEQDLFLEPENVDDFVVEEIDIEADVADLDAEIKANIEQLDEDAASVYSDVFTEIDEEINIATSLKEDAHNLISCLLGSR